MMYSDSIGSSGDLRRMSTLTVSSHNSGFDLYSPDYSILHSSGSGNVFKEAAKTTRSTVSRPVLPYVTHHSDSGFGSALSSGSSCSYLPPPPPYRMRPKPHRIHRSLSDSKYSSGQQLSIPPSLEKQRQFRGASWNSQVSLSPSPSMSTVSCPEYPELQEKLHRLAMARDSLNLQVTVLSEQVGAQKEKIRDLEALLAQKRNNLTSTEELLQEKLRRDDCSGDLASKKMDLLAEVSSLKLKCATLEREKNDTERKLKASRNEMDHVSQSITGMQHQMQGQNGGYMPALREHRTEKHSEEMAQLRDTVQRLQFDNQQKNLQIHSLRSALDEQCRVRQCQNEDLYPAPRWNEQPYDVNAQIRRLLEEEPMEMMSHSTSFPISLCSSSIQRMPRSTVQSSSSYTSSLSAASPQHSWSHGETPRHMLHPTSASLRSEHLSYRSPPSPAARQLVAELEELRRVSDHQPNQISYSSASLPRGMGIKASSTLTLPAKKLSLASGTSAGELRGSASVCGGQPRRTYRAQMNRWIAGKLKKNKRATSAPNLVESDDEIARGRNSTTASQASSTSQLKPLKRDRNRSSLRNLFSKLTRSSSQDQNGSAFRRGSAARSTSSARLGGHSGPVSGAIAIRPPLSQFVDWRHEQLADWMAEVGFAQYVPEVAKHARSGRHMLNLSMGEMDNVLGIHNPIHRKRLRILLKNIEDDIVEPCNKWDVHQTLRWLEEIGLPQYKNVFAENIVDGPMLVALTAADMVEMKITTAQHYLAISRSLQFLKFTAFKSNTLDKKFDQTLCTYPCPERVVRWSHTATCEWLRTIDLAEFVPNLLCGGTPGALFVYEPTFTAETLAEILKIPGNKSLLRRHLTHHFNQLLGQQIIADKRDFLANGMYPQLTPTNKIKVVKRGFSLPRKKDKNEICLEPEEPVCPPDEPHKYNSNADSASLESSNV